MSVDNISRILFECDPMNINCVTNTDEYDPEARDIMKLKPDIHSIEALQAGVVDVFQYWFGKDLEITDVQYEEIATKIWEEWNPQHQG